MLTVAVNDRDIEFGCSFKDFGSVISNTKGETGEIEATIIVTPNKAVILPSGDQVFEDRRGRGNGGMEEIA